MERNSVFVFVLIISMFSSGLSENLKNIVFVLTDDQDLILGGLKPMKNVKKLIANDGATFSNAFVTTPICCPSRSSILTGQYAHNHGTRNNSISGGCASETWIENSEINTFAAHLKKKGYTTFYAGKYLNQYGHKSMGGAKHVPPGWDSWIGLLGNSKYYNYTLSINGTASKFGNFYLTDVIENYAISFLKHRTAKKGPFLMVLSTPAPHSPFTSAVRHRHCFPNATALRTPAFNHITEKSKHWLLRMPPDPLPESSYPILDDVQKHRWQSLVAVDEMVGSIYKKLKHLNVLNDTYIIFSSDNGYHIGQFAQPWDKRQPYETDIRVPLIISGPGIKKKQIIDHPVTNIDIAPTILEMAGLEAPEYMDGISFLDKIKNGKDVTSEGRKFLIEYQGEGNDQSVSAQCPWSGKSHLSECSEEFWCKCQDSTNNTYNCVRDLSAVANFIFCQFIDSDNFVEAYDLYCDPYQLDNIAYNLKPSEFNYYKKQLEELVNCRGIQCRNISTVI